MRFRIVVLGVVSAVVLGLGFAPEARADGAVLVLGSASPQQRDVIVGAVVATARDGGWSLKAHPFGDREREVLRACLRATRAWSCAAPQLGGKGDQLVVVEVGTERADTVLSVHVITAASGVDSTANHFCNVCDAEALRLAVSDVTRRLLRDAAERSGRTKLAIRSRPDRAWITLDGRPAGATDSVKATYPGEHTVMLTRTGYATATRTLQVAEGETAELLVDLEPAPGTVIERPGGRLPGPSRLGAKLLVGAGAALLVGGAILIGVDEDPSLVGKRHEYYYDTAAHGVVAAGIGVAAAGVGAYLWLRASRASRPSRASRSSQPTSNPTLAPAAGGAVVGWSGRF